MKEFAQDPSMILNILARGGCGYTLDVHKGTEDGRIVQWLWAEPTDGESDLDRALIAESGKSVSRRLVEGGVRPGGVHRFSVHLDNEVGVWPECPFQPAICKGDHVVASGSGLWPYK